MYHIAYLVAVRGPISPSHGHYGLLSIRSSVCDPPGPGFLKATVMKMLERSVVYRECQDDVEGLRSLRGLLL